MSEIPSIYWMIIIGVIVLMICLVLYYLAMLIKQSGEVVKETKPLLKNADEILKQTASMVNDAQEAVSVVKDTLIEMNETVLIPVRKIGSAINVIGDFLKGLKK